MEYLNKDMVHQTHQPIQCLKVQKPVIALSKLDQLEVDLIDMSEWAGSNNGRSYVVSIIVLGPFLKEHTPKVLQSDNRGQFTNACIKETSISNISPASHVSPVAMGKLSALIEQSRG